ncbi:MAG: DUF6438 domain-containing protein [Hymenobacteraceae bacterium]|nr:DUF6438 domain-containing protein [Hymenobacteraceae bacterium]MDX5397566.1 DUF6438 domain-containing protein [Hymenobacteraceae bacterium]MDX5444180.1 DUF6438 domain-containing protein [Hymenobacteraceae bacterium]MDX5513646.1 DUF6438 domain-containing protein [Hymenobacteraceae bacterium]
MYRLSMLLLGMFLLSSLYSCNSSKNSTASQDGSAKRVKKSEQLLFRFEKTPCYGSCPVYEAEVYADGSGIYNGKYHVAKTGEHRFQLSQTVIDHIQQEVEKMNFFELQDVYKTEATDFPSTILTMYRNGKSKTVTHEQGGPEALVKLNNYIHSRIEESVLNAIGKDGRNYTPAQRSTEVND